MQERNGNGSLRAMLLVVAIYAPIGAVAVAWFRDQPLDLLRQLLTDTTGAPELLLRTGWWLPLPVAVSLAFVPPREMLDRLARAIVLLFACTAFFLVFTLLKTTLPAAVPFWADRALADLDAAFFGTDPWRLTHAFMPRLSPAFGEKLYSLLWLFPAMFLPVLAELLDPDPGRRRRFLWLYVFTWVGLGTVLAWAFSSAGPVYYEAVTGGDRFRPLLDRLAAQGEGGLLLRQLQDWLWQTYLDGGQGAGSGISAFPSVHVAMIAVLALYLVEIRRWLWPAALALVAGFQFLSVHLAWHYAVDGLAAVPLVALFWAFLRRRDRMRGHAAIVRPASLR